MNGQTILTILVSLVFTIILSTFVALVFPNSDVSKSVTNIFNAFDLDLVITIIVYGLIIV